MTSSRTPRRRSAPSVPICTAVNEPPATYLMKPTRLQDALEDANDILAEETCTASSGVLGPRRSDSQQLERVYQRIIKRQGGQAGGHLSETVPIKPTSPLASDQEASARAAVATQVAALEHCFHNQSGGVDSIRQAMHAELAGSPRRGDPLKHATTGGANTWYAIGKVVGKGTFGRVQLARHRANNVTVAIKSYFRESGAAVCSPPPFAASSTSAAPSRTRTKAPGESDALEWKHVRQEAKLMASLHPHTGLIGFLEAFETPTQIQVVMEYASGGSLCDLLKKQPQQRLPEAKARRLFAQLCGAVDALHRQNVIHRDLKLENVLLDDHLNPRIIDFGFSQREYSTDARGGGGARGLPTARGVKNFCGTPSYMAPEVVACKSYDGKLVDVWSLGIILYLLLCGKFPFQATNLHQLYQTICTSPLVFPATVSKDAQQLIQSILVIDPHKRSSLASILNHTWIKATHRGIVNQIEALDRQRVFDSFMTWDIGLTTVCDALAGLYGLSAAAVATAARSGSHSTSSVAALVRLTMLVAAHQFYTGLLSRTTDAANQDPPPSNAEANAAPMKRAVSTAKPPPSPRLQPSTDGPSHKQQLEQLIGLVKQSLVR